MLHHFVSTISLPTTNTYPIETFLVTIIKWMVLSFSLHCHSLEKNVMFFPIWFQCPSWFSLFPMTHVELWLSLLSISQHPIHQLILGYDQIYATGLDIHWVGQGSSIEIILMAITHWMAHPLQCPFSKLIMRIQFNLDILLVSSTQPRNTSWFWVILWATIVHLGTFRYHLSGIQVLKLALSYVHQ